MEDESKHEEERASEASVDNEGSGGLAPKSIFDLRLKYRTRANIDRYLSDFGKEIFTLPKASLAPHITYSI